MRAYGSDRVRRGSGEQWIIVATRSKGWVARTPARNAVTRERPGTAVLWEERYFEVVSERVEGTSLHYVLEPWRDEHVMRVVDAYDEASEARREEEYRAAVAREAKRRTVNAVGILTGHLPARVQEKLASELGIMPARLTVLSLLIPFAVIATVVLVSVHRMMEGQGGIPIVFNFVAGFFLIESAIRLNIALAQSRPIGSVAGFLCYTFFYLVAPKKAELVAPVDAPSKDALRLEAPPDVELTDAYVLREPFLTLLLPGEQRFLERRFGFDYRRKATTMAVTILLFSVAGVMTSIYKLGNGGGLSSLVALIVAGGLAVEQVARLSALRRGPAPSVLGALVRPWCRKLFA